MFRIKKYLHKLQAGPDVTVAALVLFSDDGWPPRDKIFNLFLAALALLYRDITRRGRRGHTHTVLLSPLQTVQARQDMGFSFF